MNAAPMGTPASGTHTDPAIDVARGVVAELAGEITDAVVCPGSRNTPLVMALMAREDIRVHVRIDERAAAFLALGLARAQRRHVAVCMTSGTAVANCLPALVEACQSHTPLVVLSADRPQRLHGTGASQTITQNGLFAAYVETLQVDAAAAATDPERGVRAWLRAHPQAHINVALDQPLVPDAPLGRVAAPRTTAPRPVNAFVDHGEVAVDLSLDTVVIAGDEAWEVPGLEEVPTIAEPSAPAPLNPVHPLAADQLHPQQVIVVGHPTLDRRVMALAAGQTMPPGGEVIVLSRTEQLTDPQRAASRVGSRVAVTGAVRRGWLRRCEDTSQRAAETVRDVLRDPEMGITGLHVAAAVADTLAEGDAVFAAASNPVRDLSWVGLPLGGNPTFTPRGAAGIDGTISQAIGVALARDAESPDLPTAPRTIALVGDLAFLHDCGGLLIGPAERRPENLTIVVANDDGGGIFAGLEIGDPVHSDVFERAVATPHGARLGQLCAGFGVEHSRVDNLEDLGSALMDAHQHPRFHVLEVATTRASRRRLGQAVRP